MPCIIQGKGRRRYVTHRSLSLSPRAAVDHSQALHGRSWQWRLARKENSEYRAKIALEKSFVDRYSISIEAAMTRDLRCYVVKLCISLNRYMSHGVARKQILVWSNIRKIGRSRLMQRGTKMNGGRRRRAGAGGERGAHRRRRVRPSAR